MADFPVDDFSYLSLDFFYIASKALLGLCCVLVNLTQVLVTARSRRLHSPCNLLIALYALGLAAYGVPYVENLVHTLATGANTQMAQLTCFWAYAPLLALYSGAHVFMAAIAADRLIGAIMPLRYNAMSKCLYLSVFVALAALFGLSMVWLALGNALSAPNAPIQCTIETTLNGQATTFCAVNVLLELVSIGLYASLGSFMRRRNQMPDSASDSGTNAFTRRIYKSLMAILLTEISGLSACSVFYLVLALLNIQSIQPLWMTAVAYVALVSCCSGTLILYLCSSDYRRAFNETIPFLARIGGANQVSFEPPKVAALNLDTTERSNVLLHNAQMVPVVTVTRSSSSAKEREKQLELFNGRSAAAAEEGTQKEAAK